MKESNDKVSALYRMGLTDELAERLARKLSGEDIRLLAYECGELDAESVRLRMRHILRQRTQKKQLAEVARLAKEPEPPTIPQPSGPNLA